MAGLSRPLRLHSIRFQYQSHRFYESHQLSDTLSIANNVKSGRCSVALTRIVAARFQLFSTWAVLSSSASRYHTSASQEGRFTCEYDGGNEAVVQGQSLRSSREFIRKEVEDVAENELAPYSLAKAKGGAESLDACESNIKHWVVNFYHFVSIDDPHLEVARHTEFLKNQDVRGRIYISKQGINAQLSSRGKAAIDYAEWVRKDPRFSELLVQTSPSPEGHAFPRLRLRYKPSLVQVEGGTQHLPLTDPTARAVPLSPSEWSKKLDEAKLVRRSMNAALQMNSGMDQENAYSNIDSPIANSGRCVVLLDVRNGYEWDVGHFKGADRPNVDCFKSTSFGLVKEEEVNDDPLADVDKEKVDVMMYCTGGIRCDVYATMLRANGFKNLYSLKGGISNYLKEEGSEKWAGNLFVFDSRLAVPPEVYHSKSTEKGGTNEDTVREKSVDSRTQEAFARCRLCGDPLSNPRHRNCANLDCNQLYLCCAECLPQFKGCCCHECSTATKLRPLISTQQYERWHNYRPTEPAPPKPADYVSRRALKRRRRKERRMELARTSASDERESEQLVQNAY
ncbi:hypothetical protein R1flu_005371 [Riccia fluitans]|uniref:Rhodanese domain-containing protein n=1 Tax=Riccia fluitans TaxID=41844 RepID=A0ABD1YWZ1_9MARC